MASKRRLADWRDVTGHRVERLAALITGSTIQEIVDRAQSAEGLGYQSAWVNQLANDRDAGVVLAAMAAHTDRLGLGSFVLPIYTRHPAAMVQLAATLDELSGGRFSLGVGVSHRFTVERLWRLKLERPVEAMREYLTILRTALDEGGVAYDGRQFRARWSYGQPRPGHLPIVVAALSPQMLELAGELGDGVALWMCSPRYISETVIPRVTEGRRRVGKTLEGFEVVAGIDVYLTTDLEAARASARPRFAFYAKLPYYRRVLDAAGFAMELDKRNISDQMIHDLAAIGGEEAIRECVRRYRRAGVTLPLLSPLDTKDAGHYEAALRAGWERVAAT